MSNATPVEQALINALAWRYQSTQPAEDLYDWNRDYSAQMQQVYESFPGDPDIATFYAEAIMNLNTWKMWNPHTGKPIDGAATLQCKEVQDFRTLSLEATTAL